MHFCSGCLSSFTVGFATVRLNPPFRSPIIIGSFSVTLCKELFENRMCFTVQLSRFICSVPSQMKQKPCKLPSAMGFCCCIIVVRPSAASASACPEQLMNDLSFKRRRWDLNPRAAINDLLPFQGSPFGQLGYFSNCPTNTFPTRIGTSVFNYVWPFAQTERHMYFSFKSARPPCT